MGAALLILIVTLVPGSGIEAPAGNLRPVLSLKFSLSDFLVNFLLYLPFGASVGRASRSPLLALACSLSLSVVVESAQLAIPFRFSNPFDVMANATGGITGALLWSISRRWRALTDREATWSCALLTGLLASGALLSNLLLLPAPPAGQYFIHAPPRIAGFAPLPGEILDVALDGARLNRNPVPNSLRVRDALAGDFELRLRARLSARPARPSLLFMIGAEREQQSVLLLRIEGDDLILRYRARSNDINLEAVDFRADGLLQPLALKQDFEVVTRRHGHETCLALESRVFCEGDLSLGDTWALYLPQLERLLGRSPLVSFLWIGAWSFAIGFLARPHWTSVVGIGLLVETLWATGQLGPLQPLSNWGILAALLGFATGLSIRRFYCSA